MGFAVYSTDLAPPDPRIPVNLNGSPIEERPIRCVPRRMPRLSQIRSTGSRKAPILPRVKELVSFSSDHELVEHFRLVHRR